MYQKPKVERFGTLTELSRGGAGKEEDRNPPLFSQSVLRDVQDLRDVQEALREGTTTRDRAG